MKIAKCSIIGKIRERYPGLGAAGLRRLFCTGMCLLHALMSALAHVRLTGRAMVLEPFNNGTLSVHAVLPTACPLAVRSLLRSVSSHTRLLSLILSLLSTQY